MMDNSDNYELLERSDYTVGPYDGVKLSGHQLMGSQMIYFIRYIVHVVDIAYYIEYSAVYENWRLRDVEIMVSTFESLG